VLNEKELTCVPLSVDARTNHLPRLIRDLVDRLRSDTQIAATSSSAREHGVLRRKQRYTVPMLIEESRILQVSLFTILNRSLAARDSTRVLLDVITIADEVDSQLRQATLWFMESAAA
jgi:hypothetical protein